MRMTSLASAITCSLLMSACQPSGFYDTHGNYHTSSNGYQGEKAETTNATDDSDSADFNFDRPGLYDYQGHFVHAADAPPVPDDFLPPEGKCRVFHPDQVLSMQPQAKDCRARYHIPEGTYVLFGG